MFTLSLGGGASFILARMVELIIGNFFKPLASFLSEVAKPEWFIKTAIVFLGVKVGYLPIKAVLTGSKLGAKGAQVGHEMASLTFDLFVAGAAATIVAYIIFWPGVYTISRLMFKLPRKTAAVLASAISICGVSAAVATGGAVRARPVVLIMVSALVVVYAVIELVILPGVFTHFWPGPSDPLVTGAAMGMAVKTDGADAAAGELLDEFMRTKIEKDSNDQIRWMEGVITTSAVMAKIWIDMFIGLWAFVLALFWVYKIEKREGDRVPFSEVWFRFPKFVLGYFVAWFIYLFQVRRRKLSGLGREQFPGMDGETFAELKILLKTAYERMLYLGVLFIPLAISSFQGGNNVSRLFFFALIILLFISNIPPRNKIMKLLSRHGISYNQLKQRGIKL